MDEQELVDYWELVDSANYDARVKCRICNRSGLLRNEAGELSVGGICHGCRSAYTLRVRVPIAA